MRGMSAGTLWRAATARLGRLTGRSAGHCPAGTPPERTTCRAHAVAPARLRPRHFVPLVAYLLPTLAIGYGLVIPRSCIAGWNELTFGFGTTVLGAGLTYLAGIRVVRRDATRRDSDAAA